VLIFDRTALRSLPLNAAVHRENAVILEEVDEHSRLIENLTARWSPLKAR